MAKSKRSTAKRSARTSKKPYSSRNKPKKTTNSDSDSDDTIGVGEFFPTDFKLQMSTACNNVNHVELSRLLSLKVKTTRAQHYSSEDCRKLWFVLFGMPNRDHWTPIDEREDLMRCVRVLMADKRTSQMEHGIIVSMMKDERDLTEVIDLFHEQWPELFSDLFYSSIVRDAFNQPDNHRLLESLLKRPDFNVNKVNPSTRSTRLLHHAVTAARFAPDIFAYNPNIVPLILRHPDVQPNLHIETENILSPGPVYRTALSLADNYYATAVGAFGAPAAVEKKRAARNVQLLLDDHRVDIHAMGMGTEPGTYSIAGLDFFKQMI